MYFMRVMMADSDVERVAHQEMQIIIKNYKNKTDR